MQLLPLMKVDKQQGSGSLPSWMEAGETLQDPEPYGAEQNQFIEGTAKALSWIKTKSANNNAQTVGGFYLTSVTDFDKRDAATTMASARRLV